jgi:hypothetical protein
LTRTITAFALMATVFLSGCSSGVTRPADTGPAPGAPATLTSSNQVGDVTIAVSGKAKEQLAENLKFNQDTLLDHVKRAIQAKDLLGSGALPTLEITVTDVRVRSNFSAVMWGPMAGSDHITGDVVIRGHDGQQIDKFSVSASYALGGLAGGQDEARMGWLYEKFAEETIKALTGSK